MRMTSLLLALTVSGVALAQSPAPVISVANAQDSLEGRVDRMERMLEARGEQQARMGQQLSNLQREVSELRGITEEHSHQLEQVLERQRDLYQEIERRVSEVRNGAGASASGTSSSVAVPTRDDMAAVNYSDNLSENEAYDRAIAMVLEERRYDDAIPEFRAFIESYPNSSYLGNAHYWLGQLLYSRNEYSDAQQHFSEVVDNYPDSNKRADCMLKLGIIAQNQDDNSTAERRYQQVINEYPDSTEAGMARSRLNNL
ncbi:tol-pal system protein YbgF [Aliidiomarina sedimenti]|uniref:Cell division coordinator CpoB n=2 Tax=Aliidiomarina sedimenti TaxID=1933879 RepID=A0ABY0BZ26_9GAMM|nr:tol-pal system protein YbgF [Aliidiomarina sedimenti]